MAEFFETRIAKLKKLIAPSAPSKNSKKNKKGSKKRKAATCNDSEDKDSDDEHKGKKFSQYHGTCGHTKCKCTTLKTIISQAKQKKVSSLKREKKYNKQ